MNSNCTCNTTATRTPRRSARRVVLAGRFPLGAKAADQLRKLGWEVLTVAPGRDLHEAAAEAEPHAMLVPEDAGDESGYLACAKLLQSRPELKVVLVGPQRSDRSERFAEFVGAEFVAETDGVSELVAAVV
jgi:hypothetical protein